MKKILFLFTIWTIVFTNCFSNNYWKKDYSTVDSLAIAVKSTNNIEKLTLQLTQNFTQDDEKYRAIFTWMAHNIAYDCAGLKNPKKRNSDPNAVLKQKKAVCAGYSELFKSMCDIAQLKCEIISGWSKNSTNKIGKPLASSTTHAWNAIQVNGKWYLCDVTWGAGHTINNSSSFVFKFRGYYFCCPPYLFRYNHYPKEKKWFLNTSMTEQNFIKAPHFYNTAIDYHVTQLNHRYGTLKYKKGEKVHFRFKVTTDITRISIAPSNAKHSTKIEFTEKDGFIEFDYIYEKYAPLLIIYINGNGTLAYRMSKG